jgi:hypothetical protein
VRIQENMRVGPLKVEAVAAQVRVVKRGERAEYVCTAKAGLRVQAVAEQAGVIGVHFMGCPRHRGGLE